MSQLKFVIEAMQQIVECRRILKWTYGYGYYAFNTEEDGIKKKFFEFIQADAEVGSYARRMTLVTSWADVYLNQPTFKCDAA